MFAAVAARSRKSFRRGRADMNLFSRIREGIRSLSRGTTIEDDRGGIPDMLYTEPFFFSAKPKKAAACFACKGPDAASQAICGKCLKEKNEPLSFRWTGFFDSRVRMPSNPLRMCALLIVEHPLTT